MNAIANYINNQTALDGWEVTIAVNQSTLCTRRSDNKTDNEVTYVYKQAKDTGKKWEKKTGDTTDPSATLSDEMMHRYIQSAYYSIEPTGVIRSPSTAHRLAVLATKPTRSVASSLATLKVIKGNHQDRE